MEGRLCFYLSLVLSQIQLLETRTQEWNNELPSLYPSLPFVDPWSKNEACRNDSQLVICALNNFTLWAVQSKYLKYYRYIIIR